jgi:predicted RNA-binding protein with PUA-like domain
MAIQYWLMKSEPESYGIVHLEKDKKTPWSGVRNFQARNYMRDEMKVGDLVLFYHSNTKETGVYGIGKVVSKPYPDPTQFEEGGDYYEKRATKENPVWYLVDIGFVKTLKTPVLLSTLRTEAKTKTMKTLEPGNRLSITPVTMIEYEHVLSLGA